MVARRRLQFYSFALQRSIDQKREWKLASSGDWPVMLPLLPADKIISGRRARECVCVCACIATKRLYTARAR